MILLSALAVYYLTLAITRYDGPGYIFLRLREQWAIGSLKDALHCFICTAPWVSAIFGLLVARGIWTFIICTFAISGLAVIINFIMEKIRV